MQNIEFLKRKIDGAQNLHSIVRTMKMIAHVSIRQYEDAVVSLNDYYRTIEMGLQAILKKGRHKIFIPEERPGEHRTGVLVFGSSQGMCGRFNEQMATYTVEKLTKMELPKCRIWVVGERITANLESVELHAEKTFDLPGSVDGINSKVQTLLLELENEREQMDIDQVLVFHNKPTQWSSYESIMYHLLPLNTQWLQELEQEKWPSRMLPSIQLPAEQMFSILIRQYLFVSLYRAFAESLASEHASRLNSMQAAEKKIDERIKQLTAQYRSRRQNAITEEVLDIMAGFEVMEGSEQFI